MLPIPGYDRFHNICKIRIRALNSFIRTCLVVRPLIELIEYNRYLIRNMNIILPHVTVIRKNVDASSRRIHKRLAKCRMRVHVRRKIPDVFHLYHEKHICLIAFLHSQLKLLHVLNRTVARRIGKSHHPVLLKGNALYLNEYLLAVRFHIQVKTRTAISVFRAYPGYVFKKVSLF